ncbi:hypothetical protein [Paraburkholderia sp. USG1]|uniref:hypothetical protein n=1 Tax=Paraburkholderia sp. USG1 TaxID=2952268 RepID=UPI00287070EB|nr:hypothetical protein [Paraburkholderia sp. USG1]
MSRLKRLIQTTCFLPGAHRLDRGGPFKQKRNFLLEGGIVASPHSLDRQALQQNGSIIFERPFAKKSGVSLCGKLCCGRRYQE